MVARFQLAPREVQPHAVQPEVVRNDWRAGLPVLTGRSLTLRELRLSDAPSLCANLSTPDVGRFIPPPPSTVEGFERFIHWVQHLRHTGRYAGFGMVPQGETHAVGILQVRQMDPVFHTGEWGFALGSAYWGTGLFMDAARLVLGFSFETLGVHRLEARAAIQNGRGLGALVKLGAVREATLRRSLRVHGQYLDQSLWSILKEDWLQAKAVWGEKIH
jgi:ribosomal-protein-alanine N-acetyltransferase